MDNLPENNEQRISLLCTITLLLEFLLPVICIGHYLIHGSTVTFYVLCSVCILFVITALAASIKQGGIRLFMRIIMLAALYVFLKSKEANLMIILPSTILLNSVLTLLATACKEILASPRHLTPIIIMPAAGICGMAYGITALEILFLTYCVLFFVTRAYISRNIVEAVIFMLVCVFGYIYISRIDHSAYFEQSVVSDMTVAALMSYTGIIVAMLVRIQVERQDAEKQSE